MTLDNVDNGYNIYNVTTCIDHIYEGDKTYTAKDSTKQELKDFIENMSKESLVKLRKFFDTIIQLRHEIEVTNP